MAQTAAVRSTAGSVASGLDRKIRDARYLVNEDLFVVTFDSGKEYSFRRSALEVDDGSDLVNIRLDRKRFFFRVTQASGNHYEIPWDRVLNEAEPLYPYFRATKRRKKTADAIGTRIRSLREAKGISQEQLAGAVGMVRNNISRIEGAKHRPRLDTMERIAKALKVSVVDIIAAD